MRLDLAIYGGLMALGLGAAYWASLPADAGDDGDKVKIVALDPKQIAEISLTTSDKATGASTAAAAVKRDGGDRYWVTHTKTEPAKPAAVDPHAPPKPETPGAEAMPPVPEPPKVTTERFLANEKMDELAKSFDPLVATRVIGKVPEAQLEEFGLKDAVDTLTVKTTDGKTIALKLGKRSYGSRSRFVLEAGDGAAGRVLLIEDEGLENLERAPLRLYDRRLVSFELADVSKAAVSQGGQTKRLAHTQRDKNGELLWTEDEENATAKPSFDSWMDKVAKLRLQAYAAETDEATLAAAAPFLEIAFEKDGRPLDVLRFKKLPGDKPAYYVTSDFLKVHAQLAPARMEPVEKDIGAIVTDNKS